MGRRKGLHITSTGVSERVEDHGEDNVEYHAAYDIQSHHTSKCKVANQTFIIRHKAAKNNGVYPTRGEVYIKTRTRKDGTIMDDKAAHVVDRYNWFMVDDDRVDIMSGFEAVYMVDDGRVYHERF
ncbi:hypothetical protein QVD17_06903 [Tagetes erecta]|uniref:Uncharacterized protein n=1 Tax=Tagetes erecta TaxID=13708 RepID=A0AAD8LL48_TARER|nr:hypothetical protein QVD17_06903 [Tagetes erecta]